MKNLRMAWLGLAALCAALVNLPAMAQSVYPNRPVRLVVPFPPGGGTSYVAQLMGESLSKIWGQNVLVDNRPGGNTVIGAIAVHKAAPDGYTLLFMTSAHVINEFVTKDLPFNPVKDFAPISTLTVNNYGMVVHPTVPAKSLREFIALAKSKPGELNGGTVGEGGPTHLAVQMFNMMAEVKTQPIAYKGTGQLMPDMLSGRLQYTFNNLKSLAPMVRTGKLRALAVAGRQRSQTLPDVPTFGEAGMPGFVAGNWYGIMAPKNTARDIVIKVGSDLKKVMLDPKINETIENEGMEQFLSTPEEFAVLLQSDSDKFRKLIQATAEK